MGIKSIIDGAVCFTHHYSDMPSSPLTPHEKFFFTPENPEGRSIVIQVEKTLYSTPVGVLQMHSEMIYQLMGFTQLPLGISKLNSPDKDGDYGSHSNPIVIHGLTAEEFTGVLEWLWKSPVEKPENSPPKLIAIISAARYLMMPGTAQWAIQQLKVVQPPVAAVDKIALSERFPIPDEDWVDPAVAELVMLGPIALKDTLPLLSSKIVQIVSAAHLTLIQERINLAYSIPQVGPTSSCNPETHKAICEPLWISLWWNTVARRILHPRDPFAITKIPDLIRETETGEPGGTQINFVCKIMYVQNVENSGALRFEGDIISGAVRAVRQFLESLHMNINEFKMTATE
ncbi:hypothetical protein VKT23_019699 [Stygiomarasmius scandens]|uniref:BTB domain-containing protein n=1 Tax=Marasmiellus scandens TaxID=2682957 RepID=A0ABR1IL03_9AGAR